MKPKVIVSMQIEQESQEIIKSVFQSLQDIADIRLSTFRQTTQFVKDMENAIGILVILEQVDKQLLSHASRLRVVARYGVGYDNVDVNECTRRGIYVTNTPGVLSSAVAELTIGLIIAVSKGIVQADRFVRTEWAKPEKTLFPLGADLQDKALGIIGLGRIGYEVATRARGFGMKLIYYDEIRRWDAEKEIGIKLVGFDEVFAASDYVTIHVPLNTQTKSLVGERELGLMKPSAYLINTSRGAVVDAAALCKALENSWIAGAGLDVFVTEPLPFESPLVGMRNVVLTPHMATHTVETRQAMASLCAKNIRQVLLGEVPLNLVPEQKGITF